MYCVITVGGKMDKFKNEKDLPLGKRVTKYTERITKRVLESIYSIGRPSRVSVSCSIDSPFPTLNGAEKKNTRRNLKKKIEKLKINLPIKLNEINN